MTKDIDNTLVLRHIWEGKALSLNRTYKKILEELLKVLKDNNDPFTKYLLYDIKYKVKKKDSFYLIVFLKKRYKSDFSQLKNIIITLDRVIEIGNQQGIWDLCRLPIPVKSTREKGIFTPDHFQNFRLNNAFIEHLNNAIKSNLKLSNEAELGQLLLSAILNGGLINTSSLFAFIRSLHNPLIQHNNRSFLELHLGWQGHSEIELRRWFPDLLTELLYLSFQNKPDLSKISNQEAARKYIWKVIKIYLRESKLPEELLPKNITALFNIAIIRYQRYLPPFLFNYLNRHLLSHSLEHYRFKRLFSSKQLERNDIEQLELEKWRFNKAPEKVSKSTTEYPWLAPVKNALASEDANKAQKTLRKLLVENGFSKHTIHGLLARWADHLLSQGTLAKHVLKLSTVRDYMSRLDWRLISTFHSQDIFTLNAEAFEEFYTQILEDQEEHVQRRKLAISLREFHLFLVQEYELPEIDIKSILGEYSSRIPVDANIITHEEYKQVLAVIKDSDLSLVHPDISTIIQLLIILGFRCGTRRNEVLKLRIIDIQGKSNPQLLIRPHALRKLKTKSSTRRLPLRLLLDDDELELLTSFLQHRQEQENRKPYSEYLFSVPDKKYAFLPEDRAFVAIQKVLHYVTGDIKATFHNLRHSFASWMLFRFMISDYKLIDTQFSQLPETTAWLNKGNEFRKAFYHNDSLTRRHLYAVTGLLGHASPEITLEHYIHNLDVLCHYFIEKEFKVTDKQLLKSASEQNEKTVYRWLAHDHGVENFRTQIYKKYNVSLFINGEDNLEQQNSKSLSFKLSEFDIEPWTLIQNTWKLIYSYFEHGTGIRELGERYEITEKEATRIIENAQSLSELESNNSIRSPRFKLMSSKISGKSLHCPFLQNKIYYLETAKHIAESLLNVSEDNKNIIYYGICAYIDHAWSTRKLIAFNSLDKANDFLKLINYLDLSNLKIDYSHLVKKTYTSLSQRKVNKILGKKNGTKFQTLHINIYNENGDNLNQAFRYVFFLYACMKYDDIMNLN